MDRRLRCILLASALATVVIVAFAIPRAALRATEARDTFHLYIVGGSSGESIPYAPLSFGHIVSHLLGEHVSSLPIEVHVLARSGESSYTQAIRLMRVTRWRNRTIPGAVLIYTGHNDAIAPDEVPGAGAPAPSRWTFRCAPCRELEFAWRRATNRPLAYSMERYAFFLEEMVLAARRGGLTPILATTAGNVTGVAPSDFFPLDPAQRQELQQVFEDGPAGCAERLDLAVHRSAHFSPALGAFLNAECLALTGELERARASYLDAVDLDPRVGFGRATRAQNRAVRELARRTGTALADAVATLEAASPPVGIGWELMADGHHANIDGYFRIAEVFAEVLADTLGEPYQAPFDDVHAYLRAWPPPWRSEKPLLHSGSWLLSTSVGHPWPGPALERTEETYREAAEHAPERMTPWLGIAIAQAGLNGALTDLPHDVLVEWGFNYSDCFDVAQEAFEPMLATLARYGADPDVLAHVRSLYPEPCD